jgi:predicted nucleic acid-binding Zn ribbon protein
MPRRPDTPCKGCGKLLWRGTGSLAPGEMMCRPCRSARSTRPVDKPRRIPTVLRCQCGKDFVEVARGHGQRFCSKPCRDRAEWGRKDRIRAMRQMGVVVELFDPAVIFERDGWRCQLCGKAVRRSAKVPHPLAPTVDHIVPVSRGGDHVPSNVQCAHFACNNRKGARAANDQLRLLG